MRDYSPAWNILEAWRRACPKMSLCVKASPGVRLEEIRAGEPEVEFLSLHGDLKEAVVWHGEFRTVMRRATLLPSGESLTEEDPESDRMSAPERYLYEPDPSILRAGLVRQLAARLKAARIDPQIAYLTSPEYLPAVWARVYRVEDVIPFGIKRLRAYLRSRNVGRVIVKKRGSPILPEELERMLRLTGEEERILFLTRVAGKPVVLVGGEATGVSGPDQNHPGVC